MQIPPGSHISTLKSEEINADEEEVNEDEIQDTNIFWDINGIFYEEETQESLSCSNQKKNFTFNFRSSPPTTISNKESNEDKSTSKTLIIVDKLNMIL
jgi:hypothetical protein